MTRWNTWRLLVPSLALPGALSLGGCGDPFGPLTWDATPATASIWSASRLELLGRPSAFDFALSAGPVYIEGQGATASWDVVLVDHEGSLALAPASYFGQNLRVGIATRPNSTLADVRRAPSDTAAYLREPVRVELGTVYVIRTRVDVCESGYTSGTRYAKLQPVTIDQQGGSLTFELVRNPYCSNRNFIPPDPDD